MANTNLTSTIITREAQRILHSKLSFIGNINRQYDNRFAQSGAKIGDTLQIRLPNQFTVRTGATYSSQDVTNTKVDLTVGTQKGVDFEFTSEELTLDIDDFAKRHLEPAMSVLASAMEADALGMYKNVWNVAGTEGAAATLATALGARKVLTDELAPSSQRYVCLDTQSAVDIMTDTKNLFQSSENIKQQYREGMIGRTAGFDWYENTIMPRHTTGTAAASTGYLINGAGQSGATMTVDTGTTTFLIGDVITIANVFRVHPETKASTGVLQKFVITADSGGSATSLAISPAIVATGAAQNVNAVPADNAAISKVVGGANAQFDQSLAFHQDAFAFVTADLELPRGTDMASRQVMDGLSMRFVRDFDITNDKFKSRFDVLYGFKAIRPQLACRIIAN
jgi:P22 coat protein - gene protein 5